MRPRPTLRREPSLNDLRAVAGQEELSMCPDGRDAIRHESFVKVSKCKGSAAFCRIVGAQFQNRHLPDKVAAVCGIIRPTLGFAPSGGRRNVRIALEAALCVVERPLV